MPAVNTCIQYAKSLARGEALESILTDLSMVVKREHTPDEVLEIVTEAIKQNDRVIAYHAKALADEALKET